MWVSQSFGEKTFPVLEINRIIILNFYFPTTGLLVNLFSTISVYVIMTPLVEIVVPSLP